MSYEYGIRHSAGDSPETHRTGMTKDQAEAWIKEFDEDGGRSGAFYIIKREVGPWERE